MPGARPVDCVCQERAKVFHANENRGVRCQPPTAASAASASWIGTALVRARGAFESASGAQPSIRKAMPATAQTMIAGTAERAAAHGMLRAIDETLRRLRRSGAPERIGFAVGLTAVVVGLSVRARRRDLQRIEQKVEHVEEALDVVAATS